MTTIRKGYADTSGGQLHYHAAAGDGTPIVFLHQTASSGKMYYDVMARLEGRAMIALDTPGFGNSFDPEDMPSMPDYGGWILEAIDGIGLKDFHLFGHHTGACISVEIYDRAPGRVKSAMMIGPVPLTEEERNEFRKYYSTPFSPDEAGEYLKTTWDYLQGLGAHSDLALHHREWVDTARAYMGRFKAYSSVWDQDFTAKFKTMSCPMLFMCAPDDVLMPYLDRAMEIHPGADKMVLKGANFEPDQDPDGTINAIKAFLAKHE